MEKGLRKPQLSEFQQGIDRKGKYGLENTTVNWFKFKKFILWNQKGLTQYKTDQYETEGKGARHNL